MKAKRNACRTKKDCSARSRRAFSRRAAFEPLEARQMLSAGNLFAEFVGTLTPSAPIERLDVQIAPDALGLMRDKALLGFEVRGRDGQTFDPAAMQIVRPDGSLVKPEFAADNVLGSNASVVVAELAEGNYTVKVGGSLSARSQFFMDVFLVGDANGDHRVGRDDLDFIRANYGATSGDARYNMAADANLDGRITAIDLSLARRNESDSHAPLLMMSDACLPAAAPRENMPPADPSAPIDGIVPTRGYDPDAPMRFYESTYGLVQALSGANATTLVLPGGGDNNVHFYWDFREAAYNNELGYYYVDGPDGRITKKDENGLVKLDSTDHPEYVFPSDKEAYWAEALVAGNCDTIFSSGYVKNGKTADLHMSVGDDRFIAYYVIQNAGITDWRNAPAGQKPNVWFSFAAANADDYEHFQLTAPGDPGYKPGTRQYKVEDLSPTLANPHGYQNDADYNDVVFSVNVVPFGSDNDYGIFCDGDNFDGAPRQLTVGAAEGLLRDDHDADGQSIRIVEVRINGTPFVPNESGVINIRDDDEGVYGTLHGSLAVSTNGAFEFTPVNDDWWKPSNAGHDVSLEYVVSDGIDESSEIGFGLVHGICWSGAREDPQQQHNGTKMYLLAGGGGADQVREAKKTFYTSGCKPQGQEGPSQDIVMFSQGGADKELADQVAAWSGARSVVSICVAAQQHANDARLSRIVNGADVVWFGGGDQTLYQQAWVGTGLFTAIHNAADGNTAIGGTSAGLAILGSMAYIGPPWDSVRSWFATEMPCDQRIGLLGQNANGLPLAGLSDTINSPLYSMVTDTHFTKRDRMGRLATFVARMWNSNCTVYGVGVDETAAVLIDGAPGAWQWKVYGDPDAKEVVGQAYLIAAGVSTTVVCREGERLTLDPIEVYSVSRGDPKRSLAQILSQATNYQIHVTSGTLYRTGANRDVYNK